VILAAILPVWEVSKQIIDYSNRQYIREKHIEYANTIAAEGHFDRAVETIDRLKEISEFDARAQYQVATFIAEAEFREGGRFQQAEDAVRLLIILNEDRPFHFPAFGGDRELVDLEIMLNEILIQRARFDEALVGVDRIEQTLTERLAPNYQPVLDLHRGISLIQTFRRLEGEQILRRLISNEKAPELVKGRALHGLGTSQVVHGEIVEGQSALEESLEIFDRINDEYRSVRSIANLALAQLALGDWEAVASLRREQESRARRIGDQGGLLNAIIGLSGAERNLGDYDTALAYAIEAEQLARVQENQIGLAAALQNQANVYIRQKNYGEALHSAKSALPYFIEGNELRGARTTLGIIGRAGHELGNLDDAIFGYFAAFSILSRVVSDADIESSRDIRIYRNKIASIAIELRSEGMHRLLVELRPRFRQLERRLGQEFDISDYLVNHGLIEPKKE
jgi:tetratricopeptide (TPR) repeat protein